MVEPGHQRFSSHPAHDTMDSRQVFVKRTAMLQLERAHSGCGAHGLERVSIAEAPCMRIHR